MSGGNIKVVVRCRPLNQREIKRGAKELVRMEGNQTILQPPAPTAEGGRGSEKKVQVFSFDKSYWSAGDKGDQGYASQHTLYEDLGVELLDHSFEGFNTCIFAYGQTGSGKSYSMMGYGAEKGIIPLITIELFRRIDAMSTANPTLSYTVEASYLEIYNEKVRDLLNPKNQGNLRVREHPSLGPYVEDLSRLVVQDNEGMMTLMDEGNKARTVASTNMNETSSRSHAVFTVILTQKRRDSQTGMTGEKVSKISLIDLAGSERQASTGATGTRLKEGANINKSLTTLGKVIAALAQASAQTDKPGAKRKRDDFVPYRDSILTWLLKESLGGNSKTAMIAAISPADYEETLSTLRYADAAKRIKTHAVVNEDPNAKLIRELKEELELLRSRVKSNVNSSIEDASNPADSHIITYKTKDGEIRSVSKVELQDQLQASEKLMESLNLTWEEKMAKTAAIHVEREKALEELGISIDKHVVGLHAPQKHPSLVNLNEDPLMSECLVYQIKPGTTIAGSLDGDKAHIRLSGLHILPEHCIFMNNNGIVTLEAMPEARTFVNGKRLRAGELVKLLSGYRVILGDFHVFRFNDPAAVRAHRQKLLNRHSTSGGSSSAGGSRPDSPGKMTGAGDEVMDWTAARREMADIEKLGDQDLDRLFDDIVKVRIQRNRPDSRPDLAAELESRPMTHSHTEETLDSSTANPWIGLQSTTPLTSDTAVTLPQQIQKPPHETSFPAASDQAVDIERDQLRRQLRTLAQEVRRMRSDAALPQLDSATTVTTSLATPWSAREADLARWTIGKWRKLRLFKVSEQLLRGASDIRQANILARKEDRKVSYNFLVTRGDSVSPLSALEGTLGTVLGHDDIGGQDYADSQSPEVVIRVVDREANAVYTWDRSRFSQQLSKMKRALELRDRPGYSQHFRTEGVFTDDIPPTWSRVGSAKVPLRLLLHQTSYAVSIPIMSPYTMEAIGSCRVDFRFATTRGESTTSSGLQTPESDRALLAPRPRLSVGQRISFVLTLDIVRGLSSEDFISVHAQIRLSALTGATIASDSTSTSLPVDLDKSSISHLGLRKQISVVLSESMVRHLSGSLASLDFFAQVRPEYLDRLERWDRARESTSIPRSIISASILLDPSARNPTPTPSAEGTQERQMRQCESDYLAAQSHDILVSVSITELSSNGEYVPSEVWDGVVHLRQGLQRRLELKFTHMSGHGLPWTSVEHVILGKIRTQSDRSKSNDHDAVELRIQSKSPIFHPDGTSTLETSGGWNTAAYNSPHLDRVTPTNQNLIVTLSFSINIDIPLDGPARLNLDIPIRILPRNGLSRSPSLFLLFSSPTPPAHRFITSHFTLDLKPPVPRSTSELWRIDTAQKHIAGEELLGDWRVRGLSLVTDWQGMQRTQEDLAEVQITRVVLATARVVDGGQAQEQEQGYDEGHEPHKGLLARCLGLWRAALHHRWTFDITQETLLEGASTSKELEGMIPELRPKLVPTFQRQTKSEVVVKSGALMLLRDPQANQWEKLFVALRGRYLYLHPNPTDPEVLVIKLSKARAVPSPDVEHLLGRRYAFTIFAPTNSYICQAKVQKDLTDWLMVINASAD